MTQNKTKAKPIEQLRTRGAALCARAGVRIIPYGKVWWLLGNGTNRVVTDLAGLSGADLKPLPLYARFRGQGL